MKGREPPVVREKAWSFDTRVLMYFRCVWGGELTMNISKNYKNDGGGRVKTSWCSLKSRIDPRAVEWCLA